MQKLNFCFWSYDHLMKFLYSYNNNNNYDNKELVTFP